MFEKSREEQLEEKRNRQVECLGMTFADEYARREYFLGVLRDKLKDPEFREIEGFPIGSDEDILALSDPPYYTACPNPFIADFIKHYGKPYDASKQCSVEPFTADTSAGKFDPFYRSHSYHTKVPYLAVKQYLDHYTIPGDMVLDFFAGTGMTGVAARLMEDGGRYSVLVDISPEATFVAGAMTRCHNSSRVRAEHKRIASELYHKTQGLYSQLLDEPSGEINYTVWSDVFLCPECSGELVYWNVAVDPVTGSIRHGFSCPHCGTELKKRELNVTISARYPHHQSISRATCWCATISEGLSSVWMKRLSSSIQGIMLE